MAWPDVSISGDPSMLLAFYVAVGSFVLKMLEHWKFIDSAYFLIGSFTTVGFGDYLPHSAATKLFIILIVPIGAMLTFKSTYPYGRLAYASVHEMLNQLPGCRIRTERINMPAEDDDILVFVRVALMMAAIVGIGAAAFMPLLHLGAIDAAYFSATTLLTLGLGDVTPHADIPKVVVMMYMVVATACVAASSNRACSPLLYTHQYLRTANTRARAHVQARTCTYALTPTARRTHRPRTHAHASYARTRADARTRVAHRVALVRRRVLVRLCSCFVVAVEEVYRVVARSTVRTTDLHKYLDQVLLQPSCWDDWTTAAPAAAAPTAALTAVAAAPAAEPAATVAAAAAAATTTASGSSGSVASARAAAPPRAHQYACRADGTGLNEAEFILAALTAHEIVDVSTVVHLRRQFGQLVASAERHLGDGSLCEEGGGGGSGSEGGSGGESGGGVSSDGGGGGGRREPRLGAKALFAIGVHLGKVQHRKAEALLCNPLIGGQINTLKISMRFAEQAQVTSNTCSASSRKGRFLQRTSRLHVTGPMRRKSLVRIGRCMP